MRWCLVATAAAWLQVDPHRLSYSTVDESPATPAEKTVTALYLALEYGKQEMNATIAATPPGVQNALGAVRPILMGLQDVCARQHAIAEAINDDTALKLQGWQENMMK
jgi:hypothetical protein